MTTIEQIIIKNQKKKKIKSLLQVAIDHLKLLNELNKIDKSRILYSFNLAMSMEIIKIRMIEIVNTPIKYSNQKHFVGESVGINFKKDLI